MTVCTYCQAPTHPGEQCAYCGHIDEWDLWLDSVGDCDA